MINKDTYKRLTERRGSLVIDKCGNCPNVKNPQGCTDKKCYEIMKNRLAELEDRIENGTLVELPCKVGDMIYNKNIKFYLNCKEIPFKELSKLPQMAVDRENHTIMEIVLHYIDKDAIFFYTKTEHYTEADDADEEYYGEM